MVQGSTLPLSPAQLAVLRAFVGYGRLGAPVWFLGLEEAGGGEDRLVARAAFDPVMDVETAHRRIGELANFGPGAVQQRTWWNMCETMLVLGGICYPSPWDRLRYQTERLGRPHGDTLLLELMPFPCKDLATWDYPNALPQYASKDECHREWVPRRAEFIKSLVLDRSPAVVITYGGNDRQPFRSMFAEWDFERRELFDVGLRGDTLVILSKHFVYRSERKCREMARVIAEVHPHLAKVWSF